MLEKSIKAFDQNNVNNQAIEIVHWPTPKIQAVQTTRFQPVVYNTHSLCENYSSFNLGLHVGDDNKQVKINRQQLSQLFPNGSTTQWLEQVHGNHVTEINLVSQEPIIADAAITRNKNVVLAIMTADCLPILLATKKGDEIAVIHGGWRSLASNIIKNTIGKMLSSPDEIYAWLGPCISANFFEVGEEVRNAFVNQHHDFNFAFKKTFKVSQSSNVTTKNSKKYLADLQLIAKIQLQQLGVHNITVLDECTYESVEKYYSYRRENCTGRMASLICIKDE